MKAVILLDKLQTADDECNSIVLDGAAVKKKGTLLFIITILQEMTALLHCTCEVTLCGSTCGAVGFVEYYLNRYIAEHCIIGNW